MKLNKKEHGFSMIELLTVIVLMSLLLGIVFYVVNNVINVSREKGYQTTINNIKDTALGYLLENDNIIVFVSDINDNDLEYQCVSIGELIDMGYFKSNILESKISNNRKVKNDDYIYIGRDVNTKVIVKKELLIDEHVSLCSGVFR